MAPRKQRKIASLTEFIDAVIDILESQFTDPAYPASFIEDVMLMYEVGYTEQVTAHDLAKIYNWEES